MTQNNRLSHILVRISQIDSKLAELETYLTETQDIIQVVYDEINEMKLGEKEAEK